jgi:putative transposase
MDEHGDRTSRTSGMTTWRAGCSGSCTSGSEGGPEKPTSRKADRALRSDPYTYVKTSTGWVYVAFIVDVYSRMIVGWQASRSLRTDLAIDALEMAIYNRGRTEGLEGLIHHSDRGVQYLSLRYSQRLDQNDIVASVGSKGDSYDNALIESFNGLYKWELIYPQGPWTGLSDVEFATLSYVDWFNNRRLHGEIAPGPGYTTPANYEADYYRQNVPTDPAGTQTPESL